jgi:hypothetical protein
MGGDFLEKRCVVAQSLTPVDAFVTLAIAAVQRVLKQDHSVPKWRNWQTRMVQVHVPARVWGFESLLRHQSFLEKTVQPEVLRLAVLAQDFAGGLGRPLTGSTSFRLN